MKSISMYSTFSSKLMVLFQIDLRYMSVTGAGYELKCLFSHLHIADVSSKNRYHLLEKLGLNAPFYSLYIYFGYCFNKKYQYQRSCKSTFNFMKSFQRRG